MSPRFVGKILTHCAPMTNRITELGMVESCVLQAKGEFSRLAPQKLCLKPPPKKKCRKAKWPSQEALQIAEERREAKGKGETEIHTQLNAEFQRIARREKKGFVSEQWKEIEENSRMGKTRDLFQTIRHTRGTFHAKMGAIKDRSRLDLIEEDIKKR